MYVYYSMIYCIVTGHHSGSPPNGETGEEPLARERRDQGVRIVLPTPLSFLAPPKRGVFLRAFQSLALVCVSSSWDDSEDLGSFQEERLESGGTTCLTLLVSLRNGHRLGSNRQSFRTIPKFPRGDSEKTGRYHTSKTKIHMVSCFLGVSSWVSSLLDNYGILSLRESCMRARQEAA